MANLPTGTVTFLFTDIEGSTRLAQKYPGNWEAIHLRHNTLLQIAMEAHDGYVFQIIGDAFCVAFHTVSQAVHAAVQAQIALDGERWDAEPIKVRMGYIPGKRER